MATKDAVKPTRFLVETPANPQYGGKTYGIRFSDGRAMVDPALLPAHLGRNVDSIIKGFQDMPGYEVTPLE